MNVCAADLRQTPAAPRGDNIFGQYAGHFTHSRSRKTLDMPREKLCCDVLNEFVIGRHALSQPGHPSQGAGVRSAGDLDMRFPGEIAGLFQADLGRRANGELARSAFKPIAQAP